MKKIQISKAVGIPSIKLSILPRLEPEPTDYVKAPTDAESESAVLRRGQCAR